MTHSPDHPSTSLRLAVLDMAGTTIDDKGLVYDALRDAVVETGAQVDDEGLQSWMGTEKRDAITNLIRLGGGEPTEAVVDSAFARFLAILEASYAATPPVPLPGVPAALARLRHAGVSVALTTGFSRAIADPLLDALGWSVGETVDAVVTADEVAAGRPAPYMIHRAMERTGVTDVREVCVAGDTVADVVAGRRSGAALTVGVLTGALAEDALAQAGADAVLPGVADLPDHLSTTR